MALGNDGNSKNSPSFKPCDTSNSFVKKIANRVTGLIGWRSNSYENAEDFNHEDLPNTSLTDDETISPNPKRIKLLHNAEPRNYPSKSATKDTCSVIQPVNDLNVAGPSFKSKCLVASTPAANYCVKNPPSHSGNVSDYLDSSVPSNISSPLPSCSTTQRHNLTIPGVHYKDMSSITTYDMNKSLNETSTIMNKRRPSFNAEVFSASNKRLSLSVCESRNRSCLSPFYSARTMYGGASALLPYSSQSGAKLRAESTSNLNVFSAKNQITIQPVPSPHKGGANDQETMSAAARKILDTLERYCSPIKDAKRIPMNESSSKCEDDRTFTPRGIKRKLPSLTQITPSTTDLLRIKRQEKIQDSILNARQAVSNVPEPSTSVVADSDSSSDSADLDYTIFNDDTKRKDGVLQSTNRNEKSKYDDRPDTSVTASKSSGNAVFNLGNLPRYEITETFKFSKPLTLENFDKKVEHDESDDMGTKKPAYVGISSDSSSIVSKTTQNLSGSNQRSCLPVNATVASKTPVVGRTSGNGESKSFNSSPSSSPFAASRTRNIADGDNGTLATKSTATNPLLTNKSSFLSDSSPNKLISSVGKFGAGKWTCKKCCLENNDTDRCSSCKHLRAEQQETKKITTLVSVSSVDRSESKSVPSTVTAGPNGKVNLPDGASNFKNNNNKLVVNNVTIGAGFNTFNDLDRNKLNSDNDRVIGATKLVTSSSDNSASVVGGDNSKKTDAASDQSRPNDLWKSFKKAAEGKWTCNECLVQNEKTATKCVACETPNPSAPQAPASDQDKTAANSKPKFTFGIPATEAGSIKFGSLDATKPFTGIGFGVGGSATSSVSTSNTSAQFSFGIGTTAAVTNAETKATPSYTFGMKKPDNSTNVFGSSPVTFGSDAATNNVTIDKSGSTSSPKSFETNAFIEATTTNNKKTSNPFAKVVDTNSSSSSDIFASGATNSPKINVSQKSIIRENGEDDRSSNTVISNDIAPSGTMGSPMKKKPSMGGFPLPASMCTVKDGPAGASSLANTFASPNGGLLNNTTTEFKLPSAVSSSLMANSNTTTLPAGNLFASAGFSPSTTAASTLSNSKTNDVPSFGSPAGNTSQTTSIGSLNSSPFSSGGSGTSGQPALFGNTSTMGKKDDKTNVTLATEGNKNAAASGSLFPIVNNTVFGSGSGLSASAPSLANNSIFGHFNSTGANSTDPTGKNTMSAETATASTMPSLHFNNTAPSASSPFRFSALTANTANTLSSQPQQNNSQTNSGGFAFNGPKLENSMMPAPKFGQGAFGSSSNTNATAFGSALNTGGVNFTFGSTSATAQPDNSTATPFSSALKTGSTQDSLLKPQATPAFGSGVFGGDTIKKSGGFNFNPGNQMTTPAMNNFSSFASTINDNQDQNRLNNSNATVTPTPFVFGGGATNPQAPQHNFNLTVPSAFNFNSSAATNSLTQFTASQPANASSAPVRKIKKAVRRTTTK